MMADLANIDGITVASGGTSPIAPPMETMARTEYGSHDNKYAPRIKYRMHDKDGN